MFIYQDGKLYVRDGEKFKGVNVSSLGLITPFGKTVNVKLKDYKALSGAEVRAKFHDGYKFPKKSKKEDVVEEVTETVKEVTETEE